MPDRVGLAIYKVAATLWIRNLWAPTGRDALDYLRGRGIPDACARIVLRAMAKQRSERFDSAGAMHDALREVLGLEGEANGWRKGDMHT